MQYQTITQQEINEYLSGRFPPECERVQQIKQFLKSDPNNWIYDKKQIDQQCPVCWCDIQLNKDAINIQKNTLPFNIYQTQYCINQWRYQQLLQNVAFSCPMCRQQL